MPNFSVLSAVRMHLQSNIKDMTFSLTRTSEDELPSCVIELDGVLALVGSPDIQRGFLPAKVKLRTICFHDEVSIKNSLDRSQLVNQFLDGSVVKLKGGGSAILKFTGSHVDISKSGDKKTVSNFYESLVRG